MIFDANVRIGRLAASRGPYWDSPADLLETMDRFGVSAALVYDALARESDYRAGNRLLHERIDGHPRLVPCWVAVPNRDEPAWWVREMDAHRVPAVRLFPRSGHFSIRLWCIGGLLQALSDAGKVLLIDFESPSWADDRVDWEGIDQLCAAFPALPVIVCGVAVAGPVHFMPIMARRANLHVETSQLSCRRPVRQLIEQGHGRRLVFGSDMPTRHIGAPLNMIEMDDITGSQRQAILHDNLAALLNVAAPPSMAAPAGRPPFPSVIDTHVHLGGWNPSAADTGLAKDTLAEMDRCGISAVVATSLWSCYGEVGKGNQAVAEACAQWPKRFFGYLTLDPKHPAEVRQQIAAYRQNPAFVGIKLHGGTHAVSITDPRCEPILSHAHACSLPVLVHGNFVPEPWRAVCVKYPQAKIIVAHLGGCGPDMESAADIARACRELDNLYFDLAASKSFYGFLEELIELAGSDKILYGSDHPIFDFGYELGQVFHSGISHADKQRILSSNARQIFPFA